MTKFNSQQHQSIEFYKGSCAVIAGAGSGKSTVLVNRIKNLIEVHNEPQHHILAISFTRNTADELKNKLSKMGYDSVNVGTFHSICAKILSLEGIFLTGQNLIKEWQIENCFRTIDKKADWKDILSFISYQKNYLRSHDDEFVSKDSNYTESE
jgi:DNA helicase II / ATP-dependent DNA helicase PcrA